MTVLQHGIALCRGTQESLLFECGAHSLLGTARSLVLNCLLPAFRHGVFPPHHVHNTHDMPAT
jgi:hypothetical protein